MTGNTKWSRRELLVAGYLYCRMPFGQFHSRNPEVIHFAELLRRTPSALAMKLGNIASLDPAITGSGRTGLAGASAADRAIWSEMNSDWPSFAVAAADAVRRLDSGLAFDETQLPAEAPDFTGVDRMAERRERVGQNLFRDAVLSAYDHRCCITELSLPKLLNASHIVPWREDPKNRLNPMNGLCLSALHDRAFDQGLIAIREDMTVAVSTRLRDAEDAFVQEAIVAYDGKQIRLPEKFPPSGQFLARHREHIFA